MKLNLPTPQLIFGYEQFYKGQPPVDRLQIIQNVPTQALLFELAGLNYRLKPKNKVHFNDSLEFQIKELRYFLKDDATYKKYAAIAKNYSRGGNEYGLFFTRQGCIFAIEEILNSDFQNDIPDEKFGILEHGEAIVKYILAVNTEITKIKVEKDGHKADFETLNPKFIPLNELVIEVDPIYTPYRGYYLIKYFLNMPIYASEIVDYFKKEYSLEPEEFIMDILKMYLTNSSENPDFNFYYSVEQANFHLFDVLSKRNKSTKNYKLLNIRKSPFIKVDNQHYLLIDNTFLLEKSYTQFINDFWFDKLKGQKDNSGKEIFTFCKYRSHVGYFFESYLNMLLKYSFANYKCSPLLTFNALKVPTNQGDIELADLYLRHNNKVMIGQVKSGNIYDIEKYGGDVESLYKKDRNEFFGKFGVNQIIESIKNIDKFIRKLDPKYPKGHQIKIYPIIVVNDKAFQTPLMANTFNSRFAELCVEIKIPKLLIQPLSLIHISDFEKIEESLNKNPKEMWDFLDENHKDKDFIPPFYDSVYRVWKDRRFPEKVMELYEELIKKHEKG